MKKGGVADNRYQAPALFIGHDLLHAMGDASVGEVLTAIEAAKKARTYPNVPLVNQDRVIGAMNVQTRTHYHFSDDEVELLGLIADLAAGALEKAVLYEGMQRQIAELSALAEVSETRLRIASAPCSFLGEAAQTLWAAVRAEVAGPIPTVVIAEMLGVPPEDHARFRHWSDEAVKTLGESSWEEMRAARRAMAELGPAMMLSSRLRRAQSGRCRR